MSNSATDDDDVLFPKMFEIFNTNWMHILICICGGTCCFLPLILGTKSFLEDSTLRYSLTSEGYFKDSSVASIALAFPIIVDLIFDNLISLNKWMNGKPTQQKPHLNTAEKLVLLLGINAVPFVSLLPTDTPDLALIYGCCHKFRIVIVTGIMIIALCRYDKKFWRMSATIAFLLCSTFAEVTSLFIGNMVAKDSHDPLFRNMEYAIIIFIWSPVILFCASNLRWLFLIPYDRMISGKKGPNLLRRNDSGLYFATIWVLMSLAGAVVLSAVMGTYHSIRFFDTSALMITNYLFLSLELVITVFAMHSFKYENIGGLVSDPFYLYFNPLFTPVCHRLAYSTFMTMTIFSYSAIFFIRPFRTLSLIRRTRTYVTFPMSSAHH